MVPNAAKCVTAGFSWLFNLTCITVLIGCSAIISLHYLFSWVDSELFPVLFSLVLPHQSVLNSVNAQVPSAFMNNSYLQMAASWEPTGQSKGQMRQQNASSFTSPEQFSREVLFRIFKSRSGPCSCYQFKLALFALKRDLSLPLLTVEKPGGPSLPPPPFPPSSHHPPKRLICLASQVSQRLHLTFGDSKFLSLTTSCLMELFPFICSLWPSSPVVLI